MNDWILEVDKADKVVDKIEREVAHDSTNLRLHREMMLVLYTDTTDKKFLLQQRSMNKKQLPGLWTLSVTGHVNFDDISDQDPDGYFTAASREAKEEVGVRIKNCVLKGKLIQKNKNNWSMMGILVGEYDGELKLDLDEVSMVKEFSKESIGEVSDKLTPGAKMCLKYLKIMK